MNKRELKKRLRVVLVAIRNAKGIERVKLESELETLLYLKERG